MTTAKLIKLLQEADPEGTRKIILQRDQEGNGYEDCYGVWAAIQDRHGDIGMESLTAADIADGFTKADVKKGKKVLVLQP